MKWIWYCAGLWPWVLRKRLVFWLREITSKPVIANQVNKDTGLGDHQHLGNKSEKGSHYRYSTRSTFWLAGLVLSIQGLRFTMPPLCLPRSRSFSWKAHLASTGVFLGERLGLSRLAAKCGYPVHLLIWRMTRASTTERKPASIPSPIEATWTSTVKAASRPSIESFYYCLPSPPATFCDALPAAQAFCAPPLPISLWPGSRFGWLQYVPLGSALMWGHLVGVWLPRRFSFLLTKQKSQ